MENLTPLSCMSQRGRSTYSALVFSWIFVWIFVQAVLCGGAFSLPPNLYTVEIGRSIRLQPCPTKSLPIVSVTWGKGQSPTDKTMIAERYPNGNDRNERVTVDKGYQLVINNTNLDDDGVYWCQVTPKDTTGYSCSRTIQVKQVSETEYTETAPIDLFTTKQQQQQRGGTNMASSTSSAEQTFIQFQVFKNLCLLSGVLTIWLTNVGGEG